MIAAKQRAAQHGYSNIEKAADELLQMIDEKQGKKEEKALSEFELKLRKALELPQRRNFDVSVDAIDEEQKIVTLSFSSEFPAERWFGKEILLHGRDNVDYSRFIEVGSVLRNHDPDKPVAVPLKVWIDEKERKGRAAIQFKDTEESRRAFEEVKEGLIRGVSVGYIINQYRYLEEGEVYENWEGPALIALRWSVIEISLTPVPVDPTVGIGRSTDKTEKNHKEGEKMAEKTLNTPTNPEELKRAQELERQRILEIRNLCSEFNIPAEMEEKFITEGVSIEDVRAQVLDYLSKTRIPAGQIVAGEDEKDKFIRAASAGLAMRYLGEPVEKVPGAEEFAGYTLFKLAQRCLERAGVSIWGLSDLEIVKRAVTHTASDFPIIMDSTVQKVLLSAYQEIPTTYEKWTKKVTVNDFKIHKAVRIGTIGILEEIPEGGEYPSVTFSESAEEFQTKKRGGQFSITWEAIVNQNPQVLDPASNLGKAARRSVEYVVYQTLLSNPTMSDGKALFHSSHNNLGTAGAISETTLNEIRQLMSKQKDIDSNVPLLLKAGYLIVPPAIATTAEKWMKDTVLPGGNGHETNIFKGWAEVIETPYISAEVDNGSDTAWYVVVDKRYLESMWVIFLDGYETPKIESVKDFDVDGIKYKVVFTVGVAPIDYRGLYKNPGA